MENKAVDKGTFIVKIEYRRNATWQGVVTWTSEKESIPFRSALELMLLIDSASKDIE